MHAFFSDFLMMMLFIESHTKHSCQEQSAVVRQRSQHTQMSFRASLLEAAGGGEVEVNGREEGRVQQERKYLSVNKSKTGAEVKNVTRE